MDMEKITETAEELAQKTQDMLQDSLESVQDTVGELCEDATQKIEAQREAAPNPNYSEIETQLNTIRESFKVIRGCMGDEIGKGMSTLVSGAQDGIAIALNGINDFMGKLRAEQQGEPIAADAVAAQEGAEPVTTDADAADEPIMDIDIFVKLQKLGNLRDAGIVTPEEFEAKKAELLARI